MTILVEYLCKLYLSVLPDHVSIGLNTLTYRSIFKYYVLMA